MKRNIRYIYFPILIDLRRFPCLVVGGGRIALRKVLSLLEFNAKVTVVSPRLCRELRELSVQRKIEILKKPYSRECIRNHKIVFSATDNPKINRIVSFDCRSEGILLNVADGPSLCDFIMPASLKRGNLIVSVSSQGKAPFYAKETKRKLDELIPASTAEVAQLAGDFRRYLLSNGNGKSRRIKEKAYKRFLSTDWETIMATKGKRKSYQYLKKIITEAEQTQDS